MSEALEILEWYVAAGVDVLLDDDPIDRFTEVPPEPKTKSSASSLVKERLAQQSTPPVSQKNEVSLPDGAAIETAKEAAAKAQNLEELKEAMIQFEGCNLKRTAKNLVFADGNPEAKLMFIGEAPGRDEDVQGLPFVGRAGQLLDRMLSAMGLDRSSAYITNIIPWRPPGNRTPTTQETEICRPFVERHIQLVNPDMIVLLGGSSAKTLMNTNNGIMKLRGTWTELNAGNAKIPAMPTLHPAYLLRQPAQKRLAWQDLIKVMQKLNN